MLDNKPVLCQFIKRVAVSEIDSCTAIEYINILFRFKQKIIHLKFYSS